MSTMSDIAGAVDSALKGITTVSGRVYRSDVPLDAETQLPAIHWDMKRSGYSNATLDGLKEVELTLNMAYAAKGKTARSLAETGLAAMMAAIEGSAGLAGLITMLIPQPGEDDIATNGDLLAWSVASYKMIYYTNTL